MLEVVPKKQGAHYLRVQKMQGPTMVAQTTQEEHCLLVEQTMLAVRYLREEQRILERTLEVKQEPMKEVPKRQAGQMMPVVQTMPVVHCLEVLRMLAQMIQGPTQELTMGVPKRQVVHYLPEEQMILEPTQEPMMGVQMMQVVHCLLEEQTILELTQELMRVAPKRRVVHCLLALMRQAPKIQGHHYSLAQKMLEQMTVDSMTLELMMLVPTRRGLTEEAPTTLAQRTQEHHCLQALTMLLAMKALELTTQQMGQMRRCSLAQRVQVQMR